MIRISQAQMIRSLVTGIQTNRRDVNKYSSETSSGLVANRAIDLRRDLVLAGSFRTTHRLQKSGKLCAGYFTAG